MFGNHGSTRRQKCSRGRQIRRRARYVAVSGLEGRAPIRIKRETRPDVDHVYLGECREKAELRERGLTPRRGGGASNRHHARAGQIGLARLFDGMLRTRREYSRRVRGQLQR